MQPSLCKPLPLIIALDGYAQHQALRLAEVLAGLVWGFKIHDLLLREGIGIIAPLRNKGRVFCDLKLHDIPNTVCHEVRVLAEAGADLLTVHCSGGLEMLQAAREGSTGSHAQLLGVTVLTSLSDTACKAIYKQDSAQQVLQFADLALQAKLNGVVCSALELNVLAKRDAQQQLLRVVPGIRAHADQPSTSTSADDQQRTATAQQALAAGAQLLVVGRPVTEASNPQQACLNLFHGSK